MALNRSALEDDLYTVVEPIVNPTEVIIENPNEPRPNQPTGPYVAFKVTDFVQLGHQEFKNVDNDGLSTFHTIYKVRIRFVGVNDPTMEPIGKLAFSLLNDPIVIDQLGGIGINVITPDVSIQDNPSFRNNRWEEQSEFNIDAYFLDSNTVNTSCIESVEILGKLYDPGVEPEDYPTTQHTYETDIDVSKN